MFWHYRVIPRQLVINTLPSYKYFKWPTNAQLFHKLSHCYMFWHYRVILRELVINTMPSYISMSNAVVGNTIQILISFDLASWIMKRRIINQLDADKLRFIDVISSTCFGHHYTHNHWWEGISSEVVSHPNSSELIPSNTLPPVAWRRAVSLHSLLCTVTTPTLSLLPIGPDHFATRPFPV
jgi:hypothetical protein